MTDQTYFAGKLRHFQLPTFTSPTGPGAPALKRLLLPQGELAQFHDADEGMRYVAFIELKADGVRGNHFHRHKQEFIYVIGGRLELIAEELADGSRISIPVAAGELIVIQPLVAHALRTVEPGQAIEFSPGRFDPADTYRHVLVPPAT